MIPVDPHFLYSIKAQSSFTWRSMVCELVDNAFDAKATTVKLSWPGNKVFSIEDNGDGIRDLEQMLTLGGKRGRDSGNLGYYGVGAKQALIWLWGTSEVTSVSKSMRSHVTANWENIANGLEPYPSAETIDTQLGDFGSTGTKLHCIGDRQYCAIDDLTNALGATYTPGIESGKKIVVSYKGEPKKAQPRKWPKVSEMIDDIVDAGGRKLRIRMGIVSDGEKNTYPNGFCFEKSYRAIKESWLGSGDYNASRIAARITLLGDDWILSTNKDDFAEYKDHIGEAIYQRCEDILKLASNESICREDAMFNRELAAIVGDKLIKEKRPNKAGCSGTVEPSISGKKRRSAAVTSNEHGSVIENASKASRRGFKVSTYEDDSSLRFGIYDADANKVCLNLSNEFLAYKYRERDESAMALIIYGILSFCDVQNDGILKPLLKTEIDNDFCAIWGSNVARVMIGEKV